MSPPVLSALEARILGVLFEKQHTTPDIYPLTLNALLAGCNQKTSRNPVMQVSEAEVLDALDALKRRTLIIESYGASGRVLRYAQNLSKVLGVGQATSALLVTLVLRGPQTAAELRANAERLYQFADLSSVEAYLEEMAARSDGPLVVRLARQSGERESRWAQQLYPASEQLQHVACDAPSQTVDELDALRTEVVHLRDDVDALRLQLEHVYRELGITKP